MISLKFDLRTKPLSLRPVFNATFNGVPTTFLFDTGARVAIYCRNTRKFLKWCKRIGDVKELGKVSISGFGSDPDVGTLYELPTFILSDGENTITFVKFKIIHLPKENMAAEVILPVSLIRSMGCFLNYSKKIHEMTLYTESTTFYTGYSYVATSLYTFDDVSKEYLNYMESLEDNS